MRLKQSPRSPEAGHVIKDVDIVVREGVKLTWSFTMPDGKPAVGYQVWFAINPEDLPEGPENRIRSFRFLTNDEGRVNTTLSYAGRYTIKVALPPASGSDATPTKSVPLQVPAEMATRTFVDGEESAMTVTLVAP